MNTNEFRRWLMREAEKLSKANEHPELDMVDFEDAAAIIAEAKELALTHHFHGAYRAAERVRSGPMGINTARSILSEMINTLPAGDLLTVAEAAEVLAVDDKTIYALTQSGELAHNRIGNGRGTIRITRAALQQYLQQNQSAPPRDYLS